MNLPSLAPPSFIDLRVLIKCVKEKVNNEDEIATHNKKYIEYLRLPYCSLFYDLDISDDSSLKGQ